MSYEKCVRKRKCECEKCVVDHINVSLSVQPVIFITCLSDNK